MYEHLYLPADTHIVFNDEDPRLAKLSEITYKLPPPPEPEKIHGYGLSPEEQYWKPFQMPKKLQVLQERTDLTDHQKINLLHENPEFYSNEIEFIRQQWDRRENGFWIYIGGIWKNGKMYSKPYWFTGDLYFYLQAWRTITNKPCRFRMREYKWFMFWYLVENDANCTGFNYPKYRREWATTKVSAIRYNTASRIPNVGVGLQSKDEKHAKEVHQIQLMKVWRTLPFYFRPIWDDDKRNETSINFSSPMSVTHPDYNIKSLDSFIDFKDSGLKSYDGLARKIIHNDEVGKSELIDVFKRIQIQLPALQEDSEIIGKLINTSTVDEMTKRGGQQFKNICDASHYKERNPNGRTTLGLYNFFMPATNGFRIKVEDVRLILKQLGRSTVGAEEMPNKFGICDEEITKQWIMNMRKSFLDADDFEGYIECCRQFPITWDDCWMASTKSNNFNVKILTERIQELKDRNGVDIRIGNFIWKDGIKGNGLPNDNAKVIWEDDPNGRFHVSWLFDTPEHSNKFFVMDGQKVPGNSNLFVAGGDPFKQNRTKSNRKSEGGGAVYYLHDSSVDPPTKERNDWISDRFICDYLYRPLTFDLYAEDMLMMCIYYGCEMYPEGNVNVISPHFERRGYDGYLMFGVNEKTGHYEVNPGDTTNTAIIDEIFRETQRHIQLNGSREKHLRILKQWYEIDYELGDYDLVTACGYALIAAKKRGFNPITIKKQNINVDEYYELYDVD